MSLIHNPKTNREGREIKDSWIRPEMVENASERENRKGADISGSQNLHSEILAALFWLSIGVGIGFALALSFVT